MVETDIPDDFVFPKLFFLPKLPIEGLGLSPSCHIKECVFSYLKLKK